MKNKKLIIYLSIFVILFWLLDSLDFIFRDISFLDSILLLNNLYQWIPRIVFLLFVVCGGFILRNFQIKFRDNEKLYRELFDKTKNGVAIYKKNGKTFTILDFNKGAEIIENMSKHSVLGKAVDDVFPYVKKMGLLDIFNRVYETGKGESHIGKYGNCWRDNYVYKLPSGEIVTIYGDITHIKQTENEIRKREQKLKVTFESIGDGVITTDNDLKITMINKAARDILEVSKKFVGLNIDSIFNPERITLGNSTIREVANRVLELGKISIVPKLKYISQKGNVKILEDSMSPIRSNGDIEGLAIVFRDISDKVAMDKKTKKLEDQLLHTQKLETIGQFSGSIAHDFNNILTAISGSLDIIYMKRKKIPYEKELQQINLAVKRASGLTTKLLGFSRKQIINPRIIDINKIIENMADMVERLIGEDIILNTELNSTKDIKADIVQLEQIILNLTANARDAINEKNEPSDKSISIRTYDYINEDDEELEKGSYILLEIKDSGCGITEKIKEKIFEPFFTTKNAGMGIGLGLSTVYDIIRQNKGKIEVNTKNNKGSTFKIYWPITKESKEVKILKPKKNNNIKGTEKILFVEDDKSIRGIAVDYLQKLGYLIVAASDGKEALSKKIRDIEIIVTDVVMPKMGGDEMVKEIRKIIPNIKVVFTSGYYNDQLQKIEFTDTTSFITKPYSLVELAQTIRKVLDN